MYTYTPKGVCSKCINFEVEDNKLKNVSFVGGCDGNLKGIFSLIDGMTVEAVIEKLEGIKCRSKDTSCPDQLSKALNELKLNK